MTDHEDVKNELIHYGVKGMKWGVHRGGKSSSSKSSLKKILLGKLESVKLRRPSKKGKVKVSKKVEGKLEPKKTDKKKGLGEMSDAELRSAINRLQMERQYAELTRVSKKKSALRTGREIAAEVAVHSAKQVGKQYVTHLMNNAIKNFDPSYKPQKQEKSKKSDGDDSPKGESPSLKDLIGDPASKSQKQYQYKPTRKRKPSTDLIRR